MNLQIPQVCTLHFTSTIHTRKESKEQKLQNDKKLMDSKLFKVLLKEDDEAMMRGMLVYPDKSETEAWNTFVDLQQQLERYIETENAETEKRIQ